MKACPLFHFSKLCEVSHFMPSAINFRRNQAPFGKHWRASSLIPQEAVGLKPPTLHLSLSHVNLGLGKQPVDSASNCEVSFQLSQGLPVSSGTGETHTNKVETQFNIHMCVCSSIAVKSPTRFLSDGSSL